MGQKIHPIGLLIGFATLVVERVASHLMKGSETERAVRKMFDVLVADLRREHAQCTDELRKLRRLIDDITPIRDTTPAE